MSGNTGATTGSSVFTAAQIAEVVNARADEAPAHAEMFRIRTQADRGSTGAVAMLRYRALWVGVSQRRSRSRTALCREVLAALDDVQAAQDALDEERARQAVESAFDPEDGVTVEGVGSPLPR